MDHWPGNCRHPGDKSVVAKDAAGVRKGRVEWEAEVGGQLSLCDHLCDLESIILSSLSFLVCQEERSQSLLGGFVRSKCQNAQDSLVANVLWKQPRELGSKSQCARMGAWHRYSMYSWFSLNITSPGRTALWTRPLCLSAHPLCSARASYASEFR